MSVYINNTLRGVRYLKKCIDLAGILQLLPAKGGWEGIFKILNLIELYKNPSILNLYN